MLHIRQERRGRHQTDGDQRKGEEHFHHHHADCDFRYFRIGSKGGRRFRKSLRGRLGFDDNQSGGLFVRLSAVGRVRNWLILIETVNETI